MRKKPVLWAAAAFAALAVLAAAFLLPRLPSRPGNQRGRTLPVLKPAEVDARKFFLSPPFVLLRLDSRQPFFDWTFARPVRGYLEVEFTAAIAKGHDLTFAVVQDGGSARRRRLVHETLLQRADQPLRRRFRVGVSLPAGGRLRFEALPRPAAPWPAGDVGIGIPRIVVAGADADRPADLLIISIDALRSDALGVYQELAGNKPGRSPSPELDRFAREATVFLDARTTQSATWPALASLHLSRYPKAHGVTANGEFLKRRFASIASRMLRRGYATAALLSNAYELNIPGFEEKWMCASDDALGALALERVTAHAGLPFFHWYHFWGVHAAYLPPRWALEHLQGRKLSAGFQFLDLDGLMRGELPCRPAEVEEVRGYYAGALLYTDSLLRRIFDDLKRRGLWERTLIVVTADHGEELYDHHRYFYHTPSPYDAAIRVPLLIKFPGQRRQRLVAESVSLLDIFPTLHDYFIAEPEPGQFEGLSLLNLLSGDAEPFRERILFAEIENSRIAAAMAGSRKVIVNPQGLMPLTQLGLPFPIAGIESYDLAADRGERRNLGPSPLQAFVRLRRAAEDFLRGRTVSAPPPDGEQVEISDEIRKQAEAKLRSLGYIR